MTTATGPRTSPADPEPGPGQPVPYSLTPKAHAALDQDQPIPFTLTAKAHAALDQDGTR